MQQTLKRQVGVFGAVCLGLGSIVGTGVFVGVGMVSDMVGPWLWLPVLVGALLALGNGLSSAQLAAAHPVAGGTYVYAGRLLGPWWGYLAGWLFVTAKSASAATAALAIGRAVLGLPVFAGADGASETNTSLPDWLPGAGAGVLVVVLVAGLVAGGLRRSNWANATIVAVAMAGLLTFVGAALWLPEDAARQVGDAAVASVAHTPFAAVWPALPGACALMFVAYTGYGRIATLGEEVVDPARSIPRAMVAALVVSAVLYGVVGWGVVAANEKLAQLSHAALGMEASVAVASSQAAAMPASPSSGGGGVVGLAGLVWGGGLAAWIGVAGVVAMVGVLLNLLLGVSRVVLAMARGGDLPKRLAVLNASDTSPQRALGVTASVMAGLCLLGDLKLAWSLSAFAVLIYYGLTNAACLALPKADRRFPRWIAWAAMVGCLSLCVFVPPVVWAMGVGWLLVGVLWRVVFRRMATANG